MPKQRKPNGAKKPCSWSVPGVAWAKSVSLTEFQRGFLAGAALCALAAAAAASWLAVVTTRQRQRNTTEPRIDDGSVEVEADMVYRGAQPTWRPGDQNALYRRLTAEEVLDPSDGRVLKPTSVVDRIQHFRSFWALEFERFADEEEVEALLSAGEAVGFKQSAIRNRGTLASNDTRRTSTSAFLPERKPGGRSSADADPIERFVRRVEEITGITRERHERMQVVRYEAGQFYRPHHDSSPFSINRSVHNRVGAGRILTAFLYLNDVAEGGQTRFPKVPDEAARTKKPARAPFLSFRPRRGTLLLWPNALDDDPWTNNAFAEHEAMAVDEGVKYGANLWLLQYPDALVIKSWGLGK